MEWYVEYDFEQTPRGRIPMSMKMFNTESEAVEFAEFETVDGEIGFMEERV